MEHPVFTIINDTLIFKNATRYQFNNNICNHIFVDNAFSVVIYYQHEDYYMFFLLASYNNDKITSPSTEQAFLQGLSRMDEMFYFDTEHVHVQELSICRNHGLKCVATPIDSEMNEWEMLEVNKCLGIYRMENDILKFIYNGIDEAFENGLKQWNPMCIGVLER